MRKETKPTEKRKKLIPTKRYKVKVMAKPEPNTNNTTMQPSATTPKAPTNLENQKPSQEGISESNPPPLKNIPTHTGIPWPKAGKMSGNLFELRKDWPIPSNSYYYYYIKISHKNRATDPRTSNSQCNSSTEGREVWMGTKLSQL